MEFNKHTSMEMRKVSASENLKLVKGFDAEATMWMDGMDDAIEAAYEARPWSMYVIEAETATMVARIGLTPFNMDGKIKVIKAALE